MALQSLESNPQLSFATRMEDCVVTDEDFIYKDDIVFYGVALSQEDSFQVTGNIKHFPKKPFIVTPAEMLTIIAEMEAGPGRLLSDPAVHYGK